MLTKILVGPQTQIKSKIKSLIPKKSAPPITLDGSTESIKISQVRKLQQQISLTTGGKTQPVIIKQAQNLTLPAQQALLKTLEEPPKDHLIILTTSTANQLLPTVLSRGQLIYTNNKESSSSHPDSLDLFKTIAKNPPGKLVSLAEKLSKQKSNQTLNQALGTLRFHLKKQPTQSRGQAIQLVDQSLKDLDNNINSRLVIEYLLFKLHMLISV